jgi:hypothetical protein
MYMCMHMCVSRVLVHTPHLAAAHARLQGRVTRKVVDVLAEAASSSQQRIINHMCPLAVPFGLFAIAFSGGFAEQ